MVLRRTSSRTLTTPVATRVLVKRHPSCTSHLVPRTVAALYWPFVRKRPFPSPQRLRVLGLAAAALASLALPDGHPVSFSVSVSVVIPPACESLKMPP